MDLMLVGSNRHLYVIETEEEAGVVDKVTLDAWLDRQLKAIVLMYFGNRRKWPTKTVPEKLMLIHADIQDESQQIDIDGVEFKKPKAEQEVAQ